MCVLSGYACDVARQQQLVRAVGLQRCDLSAKVGVCERHLRRRVKRHAAGVPTREQQVLGAPHQRARHLLVRSTGFARGGAAKQWLRSAAEAHRDLVACVCCAETVFHHLSITAVTHTSCRVCVRVWRARAVRSGRGTGDVPCAVQCGRDDADERLVPPGVAVRDKVLDRIGLRIAAQCTLITPFGPSYVGIRNVCRGLRPFGHRCGGACAIKVNEMNQRCTAINKVTRNACWLIGWCADTSCGARPEDNAGATLLKIDGGNDAHRLRCATRFRSELQQSPRLS